MNYLKPKKLLKGDLIGIISPASSPDDLSLIESGVRYIEGFGYHTILGKNVGKIRGYLAGTDAERVDDIHQMFGDKKVKAIFCLRGGYGAFRLLDKIDYKLIRSNPKIFVGFSEITSLQMAFLQRANLITFAGPMVLPNFSKEVSPYTEEYFWRMITSTKKLGKVKLPEFDKLPSLNSGIAAGRLIGGNLAVFVSLLGTKYLPDLKNKILLLEEISEPPYKIDRMLNQLRLNKVFDKVSGIILGNFSDCVELDRNKKTLTLEEVWIDYFSSIKIPVVHSFPHGHIKDLVTLPIGSKIKLNATKGFVELIESGVR
ncbi:MAG: LD-carboxypeptidase [Ignavibacteriaceae bacterium]|nr:LD-carboxypeptidase [Ignavibacteriaceae bacterium]